MRAWRACSLWAGFVLAAAILAVWLAAAAPGRAEGTGAAPAAPYRPGPHNVALPPDWEARLVPYARVDRPDRKIIRHLFANPEALAEARPGAPLPDGTLLVMADTRARLDEAGNPVRDAAGRFIPEGGWIALAAQQKRAGWGEGYAPEQRNGAWEYATYEPGTGALRNAPLAACFACHLQARARQDYAFVFWDVVQARAPR